MKIKEQVAWIKKLSRISEPRMSMIIGILENLERQEEAMSQEEILVRAAKIRPLMRGTDEYVGMWPDSPEIEFILGQTGYRRHRRALRENSAQLYWAGNVPIHSQSFSYSSHTPQGKAEGLREIGRITTYHRYGGYYGCLRPSTDEAIIQCPKEWLDKVCAFEFIAASDKFNELYDGDLDRHVLTTVYYAGEVPAAIMDQPVSW